KARREQMSSRLAIVTVGVMAALAGGLSSSAIAGSVIDEWASVKPPPAPEVKPVTIDPKTTALLMLVPVDGISAVEPYAEQFSVWQLINGPTFGARVTLTKTS